MGTGASRDSEDLEKRVVFDWQDTGSFYDDPDIISTSVVPTFET